MLGRLTDWFGNPEYDESSSSFTLDAPLSTPRRVSVVRPENFEDTQELADYFKRQHIVIVDLTDVDGKLSKRVVDFCAGLTYAMGGQVRPIADRLFLLVPWDVEVLDEGRPLAERAFFNQL